MPTRPQFSPLWSSDAAVEPIGDRLQGECARQQDADREREREVPGLRPDAVRLAKNKPRGCGEACKHAGCHQPQEQRTIGREKVSGQRIHAPYLDPQCHGHGQGECHKVQRQYDPSHQGEGNRRKNPW